MSDNSATVVINPTPKSNLQQNAKNNNSSNSAITIADLNKALSKAKGSNISISVASSSSSSSSLIAAAANDDQKIMSQQFDAIALAFPGITKEVVAVALQNKVSFDAQIGTKQKKMMQQEALKEWIASDKKAPCPNLCPITFKWYEPAEKDEEGKFRSLMPAGHCRITRWNPRGERHGMQEFFTAEGMRYHTIQWESDHRVGNEMFYNIQNGRLERIVPWVSGPLVKKRVTNPANGKKQTVMQRRASRVDGVEQRFENKKTHTIHWEQGVKMGPETIVDMRNSRVMMKRMWTHGKLDGESVSRFANDKISCVAQYANGRLHGEQVSFFRNGVERTVVTYYYGIKHGLEVYVTRVVQKDGTMTYHKKEQMWCNGKLVKTQQPTNIVDACMRTNRN